VQQSIDIACAHGPQQQTRHTPRLGGSWDRQTGRQTDAVSLHRPCRVVCEQCQKIQQRTDVLCEKILSVDYRGIDVTAFSAFAFSALTLLVGRQEGHPACKKLSGGVLAWLSVRSEVQTCTWPS